MLWKPAFVLSVWSQSEKVERAAVMLRACWSGRAFRAECQMWVSISVKVVRAFLLLVMVRARVSLLVISEESLCQGTKRSGKSDSFGSFRTIWGVRTAPIS